MKRLYVVYDGSCPLCRSIVRRIRLEPMFVPIEFLMSGSYTAAELLPGLTAPLTPSEVVAVSDEGNVYRGDAAWLVVLWALRRYRILSFTLAQPMYRPLVHRAVALIGRYRFTLSTLLRLDQGEKSSTPTTGAGQCPSNACISAFKASRELHAGAPPA